MTKEQQTRANELQYELNGLTDVLRHFSSATIFRTSSCGGDTDTSFISTLEVEIKALGVSKITAKIDSLKSEFSDL